MENKDRVSYRLLPNGAAAVRIHSDGYGSKWEWSCVIYPLPEDNDCAVIELVKDSPPPDARKLIAKVLREIGYEKVMWSRYENGVERKTKMFRV